MLRYYIIAAIVLLIDQAAKWAVVAYMKIGQTIPLIQGIFHLTSIRNSGAAFGILQNQRIFFIVVTIIVVIGIAYYIRKIYREQKFVPYALSLILGGALGNFVDRAIKGEVVDMLEVRFIDYPVFNLADTFIFIGATMLIIHSFAGRRQA